MPKKKLTQEDLDNNPELADKGHKIGEEIDIPADAETSTDDTDEEDDDTGGSAPPPNKERP
jgi:hypothetical protein